MRNFKCIQRLLKSVYFFQSWIHVAINGDSYSTTKALTSLEKIFTLNLIFFRNLFFWTSYPNNNDVERVSSSKLKVLTKEEKERERERELLNKKIYFEQITRHVKEESFVLEQAWRLNEQEDFDKNITSIEDERTTYTTWKTFSVNPEWMK
jgi:hypothetical protein